MNSKDSRSNMSLCEKSMEMVVNIIKLSSFSIAKMSLGTSGNSSMGRNVRSTKNPIVVSDEPLLPQFPGTHRSEKPRSRSKPVFLVKPGERNKSSCFLHEDKSIIDSLASEYIRKVHQKNRNAMHESSKFTPYILPPPPRVMM